LVQATKKNQILYTPIIIAGLRGPVAWGMFPGVRVIAVTGGIATGKSMFCAVVRCLEPGAVVFDADESVARLYGDGAVRAELREAFGARALLPDGSADRAFLRGLAFEDGGALRRLEEIFHPRVRRDCLASREMAATSSASPLFLADIPVLFESGFDFGAEAVVVVACPPATQARRVRRRNGYDDSMVRQVLAAQLPIAEKIRRADWVVWNNGPPEILRRQTQCLLQSLIPG